MKDLVLLTLLTLAFAIVNGLTCYQCPILYNKNKGEHFDPYDVCAGKEGKLEEKMKVPCDFPDHACFMENISWPAAESVIRGCAKIQDGYTMGCSDKVSHGFREEERMKENICFCNSNLCNGGNDLTTITFIFTSYFAILFLI